ncbi:hypothetical protein P353_08540 [Comamonas testosteroni]|uniref:Uncharacterized protein n=1 Tax=Comamonas testosteroni TaxID=285 RepID=A0A096H0D4_COMTE|nr:hypothetical protein P353_08540 [Comamonas testosteroni]
MDAIVFELRSDLVQVSSTVKQVHEADICCRDAMGDRIQR